MIPFESTRLKFTPLSLDHLNDYFEMEKDPDVMKFYKRGPAKTMEDSKKSIQAYLDYTKNHSQYGACSVYLKSNGEYIGLAVIIHMERIPENTEIEIGYRLPKKHWGQGYATEMAQALVDYGHRKFGLLEIYGTTDPENYVSQKVLKKVGFKFIGENSFHGGSYVFKLTAPPFIAFDPNQDGSQFYELLKTLRPHLSFNDFIMTYKKAFKADGYQLTGFVNDRNELVSIMGHRILHDFVHGKHLYIDDLVTDEKHRSHGQGALLLDYAEKLAIEHKCKSLRLCTGIDNERGKKFYEKNDWKFKAVVYKKTAKF